MRRAALALLPLALAACEPQPMDPLRAAEICEERARAAQGPTASVTVGSNTRSGPFSSAQIGVTSDFLSGRDPLEIYESCVISRTGQPPVRPPALRPM
jgi:hypothetical protein